MDISVVGTLMHDEIVTLDGARRTSFGGILYNVAALCTITRPTDYVRPFCQAGSEHIEDLKKKFFARQPQVDTSHIRANPRGTDSNTIVYRTPSTRDDKLVIVSDPMTPEDLIAATSSDVILLNIINGREISLETLRWLRRSFHGIIQLDVHNLGKHNRSKRKPGESAFPEWPEWIANTDMVQLNEWEAETFLGTHPDTPEKAEAAVLEILGAAGPRIVALTLGSGGCVVGHRDVAGAVHLLNVPAIAPEKMVDTTGCGDCFSAGFAVGYLRWKNVAHASLLAATVSSLNCRLFGLDELFALRDVGGVMQRHYIELLAKIDKGWVGEPAEGK